MPAPDVNRHLLQQPPRGAHVVLEELMAMRFAAGQLELWRRKRALSLLVGPNKSSFRGRGIDFEEVRNYQAGDDIRTIDWRVTARTGTAHTKLFREERERPVMLVVDQRNSLFFGSRNCFKSVLAAHIAALLAWAALGNGDRVGALLFNDIRHREIRPRRSRRTVLAILSELAAFNHALPLAEPASPETFADMLGKLRRVARPGSSVYLVSDFHGADDPMAQKHLFQLAQHVEITGIACRDRLESELPRDGLYAVTDGRERAQLSTADGSLRREFQTQAQARWSGVAESLQRVGIPLLTLSTEQAPFTELQQYYGAKGS